jgi:hydrogenase/urease accessory protein HupE
VVWVYGLGFKVCVSGLRFMVYGLGLNLWFRVWVYCLGCKVRVYGFGFRVYGLCLWFRV